MGERAARENSRDNEEDSESMLAERVIVMQDMKYNVV